MKIAVLITRTLLGLVYLVFGLTFFLHFIPMGPAPTGKAGAFFTGLMGSGYFFQYLKAFEVIGGFFLLINRYTALFLLFVLPITLNIFLYDTILAPQGAVMGIAMMLINLFLLYAYRRYYSSIFTAKTTVE